MIFGDDEVKAHRKERQRRIMKVEYVEKLKPFIVGFMTTPVGIYAGEPCISEFLKPKNPEDALRILKERNQKCIIFLINPAYNGKVIEYIIRLAFI